MTFTQIYVFPCVSVNVPVSYYDKYNSAHNTILIRVHSPALFDRAHRRTTAIPLAPVGLINKISPKLLTEIFIRFSKSRTSRRDKSSLTPAGFGEQNTILIVQLLVRGVGGPPPPPPLLLFRTQLIRSKREPLSFHVNFACDTLIPAEVSAHGYDTLTIKCAV